MKKLFFAIAALALFASCTGGGEKNLFPNSGDVGAVKIPGSVSFDQATGTYTLTGSGLNMWGPEDELFMVWREVTGDFTLAADIAFEGEGVNAHRKLGLIVRDGLAGSAVYIDAVVHGDGLTSLQFRPTVGAETLETTAQPTGSAIPDRITLERRGDRFTLKAVGTSPATSTTETTLTLPECCLVGLFVCSHEADVAETVRFSGVTFSQP